MTNRHRLDSLLAPRTVALVGASDRAGSFGNEVVRNTLGFSGPVFPVNPRLTTIEGRACYPSLAELPERAEHVAIALGAERIEAAFADAIEHGAKAATVFASVAGYGDGRIAERLAGLAREADVRICGVNGMGFSNYATGLHIGMAPVDAEHVPGAITWLSQSGTVYGSIAFNDRRLAFRTTVSVGDELDTGVAEYMDWALERAGTRVIGLFIEVVRRPQAFVAAVERARLAGVAVVVMKTGRSARGAQMARTHSGALTGSDAAFDALCDRHGVIRASTLDELATLMLLFSAVGPVGPGALSSIHDSGGECGVVADAAARLGVPFAELSNETLAALAARLDPGLEPRNPLDAWGSGHDAYRVFEECFETMLADDATAIGAMFAPLRPENWYHTRLAEVAVKVAERASKPVIFATNLSYLRHQAMAASLARRGLVMLDGTEETLVGIRHLLARRDHRDWRSMSPPPAPPAETITRWRSRLRAAGMLDESETLDLLDDFGFDTAGRRRVTSVEAAVEAAGALGYPVVVKSAAAGLEHKTEADGVRLGLTDASAVRGAAAELIARLGASLLVAREHRGYLEIVLGVVVDSQYGPVITIGPGGTLVEAFGSPSVLLAPFDAEAARRACAGSPLMKLLDAVHRRRGTPSDPVFEQAARLSALAHCLRHELESLDVNPLILGAAGCTAVDGLAVARID